MKMLFVFAALLLLAGCASQNNDGWAQLSKEVGNEVNH